MAEALPDLLACCQVIHQCGEGPEGTGADLKMLQEKRESLPAHLKARYHVQPYIGDEIGDVYALASLVVGRAGAGTVNELANLGKPSILVPLPGAAGNEQEANARALEAEGGAVVLLQPNLTPASLTQAVCPLIINHTHLNRMSQSARHLATPQAADLIIDELLNLAKRET